MSAVFCFLVTFGYGLSLEVEFFVDLALGFDLALVLLLDFFEVVFAFGVDFLALVALLATFLVASTSVESESSFVGTKTQLSKP